MKCCEYGPQTLFTTLHFLHILLMDLIRLCLIINWIGMLVSEKHPSLLGPLVSYKETTVPQIALIRCPFQNNCSGMFESSSLNPCKNYTLKFYVRILNLVIDTLRDQALSTTSSKMRESFLHLLTWLINICLFESKSLSSCRCLALAA